MTTTTTIPTTATQKCDTLSSAELTYVCHISNIALSANTVNGHVEKIFLHIYVKAQPTATSTSFVITKYVSETCISNKLGAYAIYIKYLTCMNGGCLHIYIYISHMKSLVSTMHQGALHSYLIYLSTNVPAIFQIKLTCPAYYISI